MVHKIIENVLSEGRYRLYEHEALQLLRDYNLPVPKIGIATTPEEAVNIAETIGYPIVLKIISPDIVHKSDVGGVLINLKDANEVKHGFIKIIENVKKHKSDAKIIGILVQQMVSQGLEVIVGSIKDKFFEHVIIFGLGGIFTEILKDISMRVLPITRNDVEEMIREIKAYPILLGYRGLPKRDLESLVQLILNFSKVLEDNPVISECDLNPVIVLEEGKGSYIVDARIIIKPE